MKSINEIVYIMNESSDLTDNTATLYTSNEIMNNDSDLEKLYYDILNRLYKQYKSNSVKMQNIKPDKNEEFYSSSAESAFDKFAETNNDDLMKVRAAFIAITNCVVTSIKFMDHETECGFYKFMYNVYSRIDSKKLDKVKVALANLFNSIKELNKYGTAELDVWTSFTFQLGVTL